VFLIENTCSFYQTRTGDVKEKKLCPAPGIGVDFKDLPVTPEKFLEAM